MVSLCKSGMLTMRIHPHKVVQIHLFGGSGWEPNVCIRIIPILLDRTHHLIIEPSGFIERCNDRNDPRVASKLGGEGFDDSVHTSDSTTLRVPFGVINPTTRVVETVLASGSSVKVNYDL